MDERTATFEIESTTDARTAARAVDELYNRLREEKQSVGRDEPVVERTLAEFEALKSAVDANATGELVVTFRPDQST